MKQLERIKAMEQCLNQATKAVRALDGALQQFADAQEAITALEAYYGSAAWKRDFAADEAGRLPADLKRGVLSEDAIWNLLEEVRDLRQRCRDMATLLPPTT